MDEATTLRVRTSTRDRVRALGAQTRQTSDAVVARAVELYERERFWDAWDVAQRSAGTGDADADDMDDTGAMAAWDRASEADRLAHQE